MAKNANYSSPSTNGKKTAEFSIKNENKETAIYIQGECFTNYEDAIRYANKEICELRVKLAVQTSKVESFEEFKEALKRNDIWK